MIYLASPYSHPDAAVKEQRYVDVCRAAGVIMREGDTVFSPIAHSHPIEQHFPDGWVGDHEFWLRQDFAVLRHCSRLVVLKLDGWEKSFGVAKEVELARACGIDVDYVSMFDLGLED
jgi:hypothetical protein